MHLLTAQVVSLVAYIYSSVLGIRTSPIMPATAVLFMPYSVYRSADFSELFRSAPPSFGVKIAVTAVRP